MRDTYYTYGNTRVGSSKAATTDYLITYRGGVSTRRLFSRVYKAQAHLTLSKVVEAFIVEMREAGLIRFMAYGNARPGDVADFLVTALGKAEERSTHKVTVQVGTPPAPVPPPEDIFRVVSDSAEGGLR